MVSENCFVSQNKFLVEECKIEVESEDLRMGHSPYLRLNGDWYVVLKDAEEMDKISAAIARHKSSPLIGSGGMKLEYSHVRTYTHDVFID